MPRVYLTAKQKEAAERERLRQKELMRLKKLVAFNLHHSSKFNSMTQEELAEKYGTSAPSLRKVQRCENVRFPYEGFLNLLIDSGLTITEVEQ